MANFQFEVLVAVLACAVAALAAVLVYREVRQMQDRITMLAKAAVDTHRRLDATEAIMRRSLAAISSQIERQNQTIDGACRSLAGIERRFDDLPRDAPMVAPTRAANSEPKARGAAFYANSPASDKVPGLVSVPRAPVTRSLTTGDDDAQRKRKIRTVEEFFAKVESSRAAIAGTQPRSAPQPVARMAAAAQAARPVSPASNRRHPAPRLVSLLRR